MSQPSSAQSDPRTCPASTDPPKWQAELQRVRSAVQMMGCAARLSTKLLTAEQRRTLGENLEHAYSDGGTIGMWQRLHGGSRDRAAIELAQRFNLIDKIRETGCCERWESLKTTSRHVFKMRSRVVGSSSFIHDARCTGNVNSLTSNGRHSRRAWEYFAQLCDAAKSGHGIDRSSFPSKYASTYLTKLKSRFNRFPGIPESLARCVVIVTASIAYGCLLTSWSSLRRSRPSRSSDAEIALKLGPNQVLRAAGR